MSAYKNIYIKEVTKINQKYMAVVFTVCTEIVLLCTENIKRLRKYILNDNYFFFSEKAHYNINKQLLDHYLLT